MLFRSVGVIPRLVDMGVEPFLIAPTLNIALAQRLVRTLCPDCKKRVKVPAEVRDLILKELEDMPLQIKETVKVPSPLYLYKPQGCKKCNHIGFSDQIGIFEVLSMTPELGQLVLKSLSEVEIEKEARRQGKISMRQDGILKALKGITTIEEIMRVTK